MRGERLIFSYYTGNANQHFSFHQYTAMISKVIPCTFDLHYTRNGLHQHDCFELCFVMEGSGAFYSGGKSYPIKRDTVFVGTPFVEHEIILKGSKPLTLYFFTLSISACAKASKKEYVKQDIIIENFLSKNSIAADHGSHIRAYFEMLSLYINAGGVHGTEQILSAMLMDMLLHLTKSEDHLDFCEISRRRQKVIGYVYKNIQSKITVEDLCALLNLSARGLFYFFKSAFQATPAQYIQSVKMSVATDYLRMGFHIKYIATALGFSEISSFSRTFKMHFGTSPSQYRMKETHSTVAAYKTISKT